MGEVLFLFKVQRISSSSMGMTQLGQWAKCELHCKCKSGSSMAMGVSVTFIFLF